MHQNPLQHHNRVTTDMFSGVKHWLLSLSLWHISYIPVESLCTREVVKKGSNISVELQSDVLLPCNFDPALLGSDMTADISVVWKQINTTEHGLLEITLQGDPKFWDSKDRRIKPFPELSESGNFSILLRKVQPSDLSLYRCELFNGTSCSIAYQEIQLGVRNQPTGWNILVEKWPFIAGGGAFALILLCLSICLIKRARSNASDNICNNIYANTGLDKRNDKQHSEDKPSSHQHRAKAKNEVYANSHMQAGEIYVNQPHPN